MAPRSKPLDWQVGNVIVTKHGVFYEVTEKKGKKMYRTKMLRRVERDPEHTYELVHPHAHGHVRGLKLYNPYQAPPGRHRSPSGYNAYDDHGESPWKSEKYYTNQGAQKWNKKTQVLTSDSSQTPYIAASHLTRRKNDPHYIEFRKRYSEAERRTEAGKTILKAMKKHSQTAEAQRELLQRAQEKNGIPYASLNEYIMRPDGNVAKLHIYKATHGISGELSPEQLEDYRATLKNKKIYKGV